MRPMTALAACLAALRELDAAGDGDFIRIIPIGDFPNHHNGAHEITAEHIQQMAANFDRLDTDLLFDKDHASFFWGDTRAAGWSNAVEARDDGLYCRKPEWTSYGKPYIDGREYRYLSPVYFLDYDGKDGESMGARLHSVAITNLPYMDEGEIQHIGNSQPTGEDVAGQPPANDDPPQPKTNFMEREELIALFGLDENATDEEINAAMVNAKAALDAANTSEPEPEPASEDDLDARINAAVEARLAKRDKDDAETRAEALVNSYFGDDSTLDPKLKPFYLNAAKGDYEGTKAALAALKANSKGGRRTTRVPKTNSAPSTAPTLGAHNAAMKYVNEAYATN